MSELREELTIFVSDDLNKTAAVYKTDKGFEVDFYANEQKLATESYPEHNESYHNDAAENFVLGIKQVGGQ